MAGTKPKKKIVYKVDATKRKRFPAPMFKKVYEVNQEEAKKFLKRNGRLPNHVYAVEVEQ